METEKNTVPTITTNSPLTCSNVTVPPSNACTFEGFQQQSSEQHELITLKSTSLAYMASKQVLQNRGILKEFKQLFSDSIGTVIQRLRTYTTELLDEYPDSSDTMRHLSDILLQQANSEHQDNYVVLIGDGKTYIVCV